MSTNRIQIHIRHHLITIPAIAWVLSGAPLGAADAKPFFACDFTTPLASEWSMVGGRWDMKEGHLKQTQPKPADPTKAILVAGDREDLSGDVVVLARLRLDSWKDGVWARAGISVCSDPVTGHGINLVFRQGKLSLVHEFVMWGPGVSFPYQVGAWYWMKLCKTGGVLQGKAWPEGDPEPADWMVTWKRDEDEVTGYPALVGGAGGPGDDICTVSFASCQVLQDEGLLQARKGNCCW